MYNGVTEAFKSKLAEPSRTFRARLINTANSGEVISDGFFSVKSYGQSNEDNETLSLGGTVSTYIEVEIYQPAYMVTGKEYEYQIGLLLGNGTVEYVTVGKFTAQKPTEDDGKVTFTAYDRFVSKLGYLFTSELTYPVDGKTILNEIQTKSGVPIANISSLPDGVMIPKRTSVSEADEDGNTSTTYVNPFDGFSYRETIGYLALIYGKFATINRNGAVELRWYTDNGYRVEDNMSYNDITCAETAFEVKYVQCTIGDDSDNVLISGSGATGISANAPVMTQALLDSIYAKVGGMIYTPTTLSFKGDPRIDLGDIITVVKRDGTEVKVPVMTLNFDYDGGLTNEVGSYGDTEQSSQANDAGPTTKRMDRVYSDLLLVKEVVATKASIAYLQANYANITELDAATARIDILESSQITTSYLQANFAKLDLSNITTGSITNAMLGTAVVDTANLKDASITDGKIIGLTATKLTAGTIDASYISVINLNCANLTVGTINGTQIASNTIGYGNLSSAAVTSITNTISIGGRNLALTSGGYTATGTTKWVIDSNHWSKTLCDGYVRFTKLTTTAGSWIKLPLANSLELSKQYTVTLKFKRSVSASFGVVLSGPTNTMTMGTVPAGTAGTITTISFTFTTNATYEFNFIIFTSTNFTTVNETFDIYNIKLEKGNKATDWTPAPEDVDASINAVLATADGKNTTYYQTAAPSGGTYEVNDIWFDTDDGNRMYYYSGSAWTATQFGTNAIVASAITADKIAASAVTAGAIAAGAITAAAISAGAVSTEKLAAGAVTATNIASNAITTDKLAAGAITAEKLYAGSGSNLYSLGYDIFEQITNDNLCYLHNSTATATVDSTTAYYGSKCLKIVATGADAYICLGHASNKYGCIPVVSGQMYRVSCYAKSASGSIQAQLYVAGHTAINSTCSTFTGTSLMVGTTWTRLEFTYTASSTYPYISIRVDNDGGAGTTMYFDAIMVEPIVSATQVAGPFKPAGMTVINGANIVTGTITANSIAATTITADKINLQDVFSKNITATGTITGLNLKSTYIESTSGLIGGFTIGSSSLHNGTTSLAGATDSVYLGLDGISCGTTFKVTKVGDVYITAGDINLTSQTYKENRITITYTNANNYVANLSLSADELIMSSTNTNYDHNMGLSDSQILFTSKETGNTGQVMINFDMIYMRTAYDVTETVILTPYLSEFKNKLSIGNYYNSNYALSAASFICNSWIRTVGATGWYNETYGGGWYMGDSTYIRNYGNTQVLLNAALVMSASNVYFDTDWGIRCLSTSSWLLRQYNASGHANATALGTGTYDTLIYTAGNVWKGSSSTTYFATTSTSDRRLKEFVSDMSIYEGVFMELRSIAFKYHDGLYNAKGKAPLVQWGFYAQDTIKAFEKYGIDWHEQELVVMEDGDLSAEEQKYVNGDMLKMNYQNMIALDTHMIQATILRVDDQEWRLKEVQNQLYSLQFAFARLQLDYEQLQQKYEELKQAVA